MSTENVSQTTASMGWEECTPLQIADLLAYENFKDALRLLQRRKRRRKTLRLLIDLGTFGGGVRIMGREALLSLRQRVNASEKRRKRAQNLKDS